MRLDIPERLEEFAREFARVNATMAAAAMVAADAFRSLSDPRIVAQAIAYKRQLRRMRLRHGTA